MEQTGVFVRLSVKKVLDFLTKTAILSPEEMDLAVNAAKSAADGYALARALVVAGVLTPYQMQAVCRRNHAELRIGNYDVLDHLGDGGMGSVFKARHRRMKRIVALKVLSRTLVRDDSFVRRFQREVETIARLSHPNIVMAYDADEDEAGPYLVMEYVDGLDLSSLVKKQGPLDLPSAVNCILQAARGLAYAHDQGIIHRDIKPANLLRDASGTVKLTDLGLARLNSIAEPTGSAPSNSITQAGGVMGTVDYMSPEQAIDSTSIDHRADIYSLGATLHFLLAGRPPYEGNTTMAAFLEHRQAPIPALAAARKGVPGALDVLFRRMMAKEPVGRPQTAGEIVHVLESIAATPGDALASPAGSGERRREEDDGRSHPLPPSDRPLAPSAPGPRGATMQGTTPGSTDLTNGPKTSAPSTGSRLKVLLVEPSRTQSGIFRKYLKTGGIEDVIAVASGQEALAAARSETPDAIISAQHLPDMTGVDLAQQIRGASTAAAPRFVLISSAAESSEMGSLSKVGHVVLLHKPFTPAQLVEALRGVSP